MPKKVNLSAIKTTDPARFKKVSQQRKKRAEEKRMIAEAMKMKKRDVTTAASKTAVQAQGAGAVTTVGRDSHQESRKPVGESLAELRQLGGIVTKQNG